MYVYKTFNVVAINSLSTSKHHSIRIECVRLLGFNLSQTLQYSLLLLSSFQEKIKRILGWRRGKSEKERLKKNWEKKEKRFFMEEFLVSNSTRYNYLLRSLSFCYRIRCSSSSSIEIFMLVFISFSCHILCTCRSNISQKLKLFFRISFVISIRTCSHTSYYSFNNAWFHLKVLLWTHAI